MRKLTYISSAVVADNKVDETDEEILNILAPPVCEVSAERVQDDEVFVRRVEEGLRQEHDHEANQTDPIRVVLAVVVISGFHDANTRLPDQLVIDTRHRRLIVVIKRCDSEPWLKEQHRDGLHQLD